MVKYSDQVSLCKTGRSDIFGACRHTEPGMGSLTSDSPYSDWTFVLP
jgi:hypothetical protein